MEAPPDELDVRAGLYFVCAAWAPSVATASEKTATRTANAYTRERRTTYGTTATTPSLSSAYGVSCRARAERAALGLHLEAHSPPAINDGQWFPRSSPGGRQGFGVGQTDRGNVAASYDDARSGA